MTTQSAIQTVLRESYVKWEPRRVTYTTNRGKAKDVIAGVVGPLFWKHYKKDESLRNSFRLASAWLRKVDNKWEVMLGINRHTVALIAAALMVEITDLMPEEPAGECTANIEPADANCPF